MISNLNSGSELFEGKKIFEYNTHYKMPKVKFSKNRRRTAYKGIVNQEPVKAPPEPMLFDNIK